MSELAALALRFLSKYLFQILVAVSILVLYLVWAHHQQAIGEEKVKTEVALRDARIAGEMEKLLRVEKENVEKLNAEKVGRLTNAVKIYAERNTSLGDDVANLVKRMRNARPAGACGKNSLPGGDNDNERGKSGDHEGNYDIALAAITLANLCEKKINELKVVDP